MSLSGLSSSVFLTNISKIFKFNALNFTSKKIMTKSAVSILDDYEWTQLFSTENKTRALKLVEEVLTGENDQDVPYSIIENTKEKDFRKAAVLIPLCYDVQYRPSILYELRAKNLKAHGGEISFPGGGMDPGDKDDFLTTALRETEEEIGISPAEIEIFTSFPMIPTRSLFGVKPVAGFIKGPLNPLLLKINPDEVESVFTVPIEHLVNPLNWIENDYKGFKTPAYGNINEFCPKNDDNQIIWGLTGMLTHIILKFMVPNNLYTMEIPWMDLIKPTSSKL